MGERRRIDLVALAIVAVWYLLLAALAAPWVVMAVVLWRWWR